MAGGLQRWAAALFLAFAVPCIAKADITSYSGTVEPCLSPHGDRDQYHAGLETVGWTDINFSRRNRR